MRRWKLTWVTVTTNERVQAPNRRKVKSSSVICNFTAKATERFSKSLVHGQGGFLQCSKYGKSFSKDHLESPGPGNEPETEPAHQTEEILGTAVVHRAIQKNCCN